MGLLEDRYDAAAALSKEYPCGWCGRQAKCCDFQLGPVDFRVCHFCYLEVSGLVQRIGSNTSHLHLRAKLIRH